MSETWTVRARRILTASAVVAGLVAVSLAAPSATAAGPLPPLPILKNTPTPTPTPKPTVTPTPTPTGVPKIAGASSCANTSVRYQSYGSCVSVLENGLKTLGFFAPTPDRSATKSTINAILNYQRSRGMSPDGVAGYGVWTALAQGRAEVPLIIPSGCRGSGVVICVDLAHRKLFWYKNGSLQRTVPVRTGGFTSDAITGQMKIYATVEGVYRVYNKDPNPYSKTYGAGAMPYSVMFNPNMYVHYSSGFANEGYNGSSHGCVNVGTYTDAKWIYYNTPIGAKVIVFDGRW